MGVEGHIGMVGKVGEDEHMGMVEQVGVDEHMEMIGQVGVEGHEVDVQVERHVEDGKAD